LKGAFDMSTATSAERLILDGNRRDHTVAALQQCLTTLIDLALQFKQAHWNLVGDRFLSVHEQLDTIIDSARAASDEVAERIAALGVAADGRPGTVDEHSALDSFPEGRLGVDETVRLVADRLQTTSQCLRKSIDTVSDLDPISEDMLIGICGPLEKHLWMVQSQEITP
jgi:starvation-inducible DNA-binding protein